MRLRRFVAGKFGIEIDLSFHYSYKISVFDNMFKTNSDILPYANLLVKPSSYVEMIFNNIVALHWCVHLMNHQAVCMQKMKMFHNNYAK